MYWCIAVMTAMRQITFRVDADLWKKFTIRCVEKGTKKTAVLVKSIEIYIKEK